MIRGPAERDGELQAVECRQEPLEQRVVFDGELAGEPVVAGVVEIELRLEAGKIGRPLLERGEGFAQLIALRPVLGVIDDEIFAAGERQRIIERLWLGARVKVRHHHYLDIARERVARATAIVSTSTASRISLMSSFAHG